MKTNDPLTPSDWHKDEELWKLLGQVPEIQPSDHFAYSIRKKIAASPDLIPLDWEEDKALWELLGRVPEMRPSSNFAYLIQQKIESVAQSARELPGPIPALLSFLRKHIGAAALTAACLTVMVFWSHHHYSNRPIRIGKDVDVVELVNNYDLIQDLEVIENLDQL